jgi:hypothetical protein
VACINYRSSCGISAKSSDFPGIRLPGLYRFFSPQTMTDSTESHADISALLEETMLVLTPQDQPLSTRTGADSLSNWIDLLAGVENADDVRTSLKALRDQLQSPHPAGLPDLLTDLADKTRVLGAELGPEGDMASRLEALSGALRTVAGSL